MNLLAEELRKYVQPTTLTRKLTLDGETKAYPVYRVRLECLYYNDQNDRIATYITQYKSENGLNAFQSLDMRTYNDVVEQFIVQSNPASIEKTQMNIELVGQREPGVVLSDGRVVDGNRRFTCLRRLAEDNPAFCWFETVILNERMRDNKKHIKMLELAIQHGEEKKVDYNPIDRLVGIYQDIIKTKLLTIEEYAQSINETESEVKSKMEHALLLMEFLEYIGLPEHYHIARDYQIVSVLGDLNKLLKKAKKDAEKQRLKEVIFNNILMKTTGDSRKYLRSIGAMMDTNIYTTYLKKQAELGDTLHDAIAKQKPRTMKDFETFITANTQLADEMRNMFDIAILKSKKHETKARPSLSVSKSITMLRDVDTKIFETLNDAEREKLTEHVELLLERVHTIKKELTCNAAGSDSTSSRTETNYSLAVRHIDEPMAVCTDMENPITNPAFILRFRLEQPLPFQKDTAEYQLFFLSEEDCIVSNINTVTLSSSQLTSCGFVLSPDMIFQKSCCLAVRSAQDPDNMLQQKIPFTVMIQRLKNDHTF